MHAIMIFFYKTFYYKNCSYDGHDLTYVLLKLKKRLISDMLGIYTDNNKYKIRIQ